ncbi:neurotrimin-like isoform X2 [Vespula maculifrons]|uniref:Neurotrimin-like isoform X2 n=1 Tax=Vespula maculifrons TaxID=7453 RepID=A0ABD2CW70_VESMC
MSTYLIFNQLQIIHPQFRPKSRSSVLEPSQNFLSNTTGRVSKCLKPTVWTVEQSPVGPKVQQPPRGGTWVGSTCDTSETHRLQVLPSEWLHSSRFFQDFLYQIPIKSRRKF